MIVAWLAFFDSLLAISLLAAGVVGAHWHYFPPILGFSVFLLGSLLGVVAFLLGRTFCPCH